MRKLISTIIIATTILCLLSCSDEVLSSFDEDEGLKTEFPSSLFEFIFDYIPLKQGAELSDPDSIHIPIPLDPHSFANFKAISDVKNESGIRYVESVLIQEVFGVPDSASFANNIFKYNYTDESKLVIKLNVATSGDALNGEPYEKSILLDFLKIGKSYPTVKDQLGAIEVIYVERNTHSNENEGRQIFVGIDQYNNIGESLYTVKVINVEDHEDFTRDGEMIKKALKVTIEFLGLFGVSSHPDLSPELKADQFFIQNGRASFIIDYLQ